MCLGEPGARDTGAGIRVAARLGNTPRGTQSTGPRLRRCTRFSVDKSVNEGAYVCSLATTMHEEHCAMATFHRGYHGSQRSRASPNEKDVTEIQRLPPCSVFFPLPGFSCYVLGRAQAVHH